MSRLESRPARTGLWEYLFFVDLEGHATDPPVRRRARRAARQGAVPQAAGIVSRRRLLRLPADQRPMTAIRTARATTSITATRRRSRRSTCAGSRRTCRASRSSELAREFGLDERDIVKLASNENPRGPSPAVRAAIAAATAELCRYPGRQRLRAEGRARARATASTPSRSCSATARTTSSSSSRRRSCSRATTRSIRATRSPCIRWRRRRAAASASRCRRATSATTCGDAPRDHADDAHRVRRQSEQSDRHVAPPAALEALHRVGAGGHARRARRGLQRIPAAGAAGAERRVGRRSIRT